MITPETDPNHEIVGRIFRHEGKVYFCDSYDARHGYWITEMANPDNRRNVSERAIGRGSYTIREIVDYHKPAITKPMCVIENWQHD